MKISQLLKIISAIFEGILAIPIIGGLLVFSFLYIPLVFMLFFHITTYYFSKKEDESTTGSIVGIITSLIGWIPFFGWIMHVVTCILLIISLIQKPVIEPESINKVITSKI